MFDSALSGRRLIIWLLVALSASCNLGAGEAQTVISGVPTVQLSAPLPNAIFMEGVPVNVQALIANAGPDIGRVEIVVDGTVVASIASPNTTGAAAFSIPTQSWTAAGAGPHTITVTAFRADGSSSTPVTVNVTVVSQTAETEEPTASTDNGGQQNTPSGGQNTSQTEPTQRPEATQPPEPTEPPEPEVTDTPSRPTATINQGVNLRRGPGTVFNPPVGSMPANATAEIIAVNPSGDWYKVRSTFGEGWISASFVTVSGDVSGLRVDPGPPTPVPFTPTPVFTATPVTSANLIIVGTPVIRPHPLLCSQAATIQVTVQNNGTGPTAVEGRITVEDFHTSDNARQQSTQGTFPVLQPGQSFTSDMRLTVSTFFNEGHRIVITIDNERTVPETNDGDNQFMSDYVLQKGTC